MDFNSHLEDIARNAVVTLNEEFSPEIIIQRNIAFILNQIGEQRKLRDRFLGELHQAEFYTYLEIIKAKKEALYNHEFNPRVDRLKDIIANIDREKRNIEVQNKEVLSRLFEKLLHEINQHLVLQFKT